MDVNGEPLPLIVRKSDGGYGYPATDLACVRDRTGRIGATRLVYVVGAEQSLHLRMVFAVGTMAGYLPDPSTAVHAGFGLVLGTDGKGSIRPSNPVLVVVRKLAATSQPGN